MDNIAVHYRDMPYTIRALVVSSDGYFTIILNSRNSYEQNRISYIHELRHIMRGDFSRSVDVSMLEAVRHF